MLTLEAIRIVQDDFTLTADLSIPAGGQVAIMGPSGAGKSTLLSVISGFLAPVSGRVLWQGRDITATPPGERPIGTIFQDNNLFPHLDVFRNLALGVRPSGRLDRAETARVNGALARVGLEGFGARRPATLSGGQQSRAALARMLVQARPVIVLDEPFAALGPALRAEMIELVRTLGRDLGATILMVTHDPGDARRLGGMLSVVSDRTVSAPAPADALLDDPPPGLRAYLG